MDFDPVIKGIRGLRVSLGNMTVHADGHIRTTFVGADNLHGQGVIPDFLEQGRHLQELQRIVREDDGDRGIDHSQMILDGISGGTVQALQILHEVGVFHQIPGRRHFIVQILLQDGDIFPVGNQLRTHQLQGRPNIPAGVGPVHHSLYRERDRDTRDDGEQPVHKIQEPVYDSGTLFHDGDRTLFSPKIVFFRDNCQMSPGDAIF